MRAPLEALADDTIAGAFTNGVGRAFHWELEFPDVFLDERGGRLSDGGFHAVIGNPPYVRIQALGRQLAEYCRRHYRLAHGSFDTYIPFIERSLSLLAPAGRLGFIVPNRFLKLEYATRLRERLAHDALVEEVVDFGDAQLFAGATNYTCILLLDRRGQDELTYRRVSGAGGEVRRALLDLDALPATRYRHDAFDGAPWVLATGEAARVIAAASRGAERLGVVIDKVFTGLQTSADPVFVLEDRGRSGALRRVLSHASGEVLELEENLLHPLASGLDVERYAFRPVRSLLLFPYRRDEKGAMRLLSPSELGALPATAAYLEGHEAVLRARERGRMDHDGWYGFGRVQSLGAHDSAKLGVAATVRRLEIAADPDGQVYFHNVRVNGILLREEGPSIWTLLVLLNSRLLDYVFRRGTIEHAGGHYAANRQFIAPLPVKLPADADSVARLGRDLHQTMRALHDERRDFLIWLESAVGARAEGLRGHTTLARYEVAGVDGVLDVLFANRSRLKRDPGSRSFGEQLRQEWSTSVARLADSTRRLAGLEARANDAVYDAYEITAAHRAIVDAEYANG